MAGETIRGMLRADRRGLYTIFESQVDATELCRLYAEFEGGEVALGVPAPEDGRMVLRASIPTGHLPGGALLLGRLRPTEETKREAPGWAPFPGGQVCGHCFPRGLRQGNTFRFPWHAGQKLPCEELLCFYRYVREGTEGYLQITLEDSGAPKV